MTVIETGVTSSVCLYFLVCLHLISSAPSNYFHTYTCSLHSGAAVFPINSSSQYIGLSSTPSQPCQSGPIIRPCFSHPAFATRLVNMPAAAFLCLLQLALIIHILYNPYLRSLFKWALTESYKDSQAIHSHIFCVSAFSHRSAILHLDIFFPAHAIAVFFFYQVGK